MIENASLVHVKLAERRLTSLEHYSWLRVSVVLLQQPHYNPHGPGEWNVKVGVPVGWVGHPQSNKHTPKGPDELELLPAKREEPDIYKKFYQRQRAGKEIRGC